MKIAFHRLKKFNTVFCICFFICIVCFNCFQVQAVDQKSFVFNHQSEYWPTHSWRQTSPERQGMSSEKLLEMFKSIKQKPFSTRLRHKVSAIYLKEPERKSLIINGVLIARNGYIVAEATSSHHFEARRPIYSSTKSVLSALFGIALHQGYFQHLDQRMIDFFQDTLPENPDPLLSKISLKHLLTMTCGFQWQEWEIPYLSPENPVHQMLLSGNWIEFVFDQPISQQPGTAYNYNSGCSQLLATIIHKKK